MRNPRVGQWVAVDGHESEGAARVRSILHATPGGVRLDRKVQGFYCWNASELSAASGKAKEAAIAADHRASRALANQGEKP